MINEWPESEERIDMISLNGGDGLHYLDIKRQMLEEPTDKEVLDWLLTGNKNFDTYRTYDGTYFFICRDNSMNKTYTKSSTISYKDAIKKVMKE